MDDNNNNNNNNNNEASSCSADDITGDDLKLVDEMCHCYRQGLNTFRRMLAVVRQRLHCEPNPDQAVRDQEWTWLLSYENLLDCIERNVDPINYQFEQVELSSAEEMAEAWQQFEQQWELSGLQRAEVTSSTVCTITLHSLPQTSTAPEETQTKLLGNDWSQQHNAQLQLNEATVSESNAEWLQVSYGGEMQPANPELTAMLDVSWVGNQLQTTLESTPTPPNWLSNENQVCFEEAAQCNLSLNHDQIQYDYNNGFDQMSALALAENGQYATESVTYTEGNYAFNTSPQANYAMQPIYDVAPTMNGADTAQAYSTGLSTNSIPVSMPSQNQLPFDDNYDLDKLFENNYVEITNQDIESALNQLDFGTTTEDVDSNLLQLLSDVDELPVNNNILLNLQFDQLLE